MEMHEVRYFLAVCDALNFTRAAERCNVSQPSLTRAIQVLESKLGGGPLVHRERGNTHLTELGRLMEPYFREMLANVHGALSTASNYANVVSGRLKLGLMCTIGPARMIDLLGSIRRHYPQIRLQLRDGTAASLFDQLTTGELDAAIFCRPDAIDESLHVMPLYRERFMVIFPPTHPWTSRREIRLCELHGQPYLNRISCEYNDHIDAIMAKLGVEPEYPYESERDDWIQSMIMSGFGCTTIPEFAITIPGLPSRPLVEPEVLRTINLVTVRGRPHGPAVGALVHVVKKHVWHDAPAVASLTAHDE
jgi:LysR family transcriptional regulator, hydrogen peroxide-inducible genes activator